MDRISETLDACEKEYLDAEGYCPIENAQAALEAAARGAEQLKEKGILASYTVDLETHSLSMHMQDGVGVVYGG